MGEAVKVGGIKVSEGVRVMVGVMVCVAVSSRVGVLVSVGERVSVGVCVRVGEGGEIVSVGRRSRVRTSSRTAGGVDWQAAEIRKIDRTIFLIFT